MKFPVVVGFATYLKLQDNISDDTVNFYILNEAFKESHPDKISYFNFLKEINNGNIEYLALKEELKSSFTPHQFKSLEISEEVSTNL